MEGLPSEKTAVERLGQALKERESFLAQLKAKTKAFVDNLKAEKAALEATLESQAQALDELSAERDALKQKVRRGLT
jgi:cell division protein FtsB